MEKFKTIPSFPDYEVSNFGRVKTKARMLRYSHAVTGNEHFRQSVERFLKEQYNTLTGYKFYQLYKDKKMYNRTVHLLVADAFIPKIQGRDFINHIDGNKHNNTVDNLERCTNEYNHEHATRTGLKAKGENINNSKLNNRMVHAIKWYLRVGQSHSEIAKAFQVSRTSITQINTGKIWKHVVLKELQL